MVYFYLRPNISYASTTEGENALSALGFIHIPEGKMLRVFTGYVAGANDPAVQLIDIPKTGSGINVGYSVNILRTEDVERITVVADSGAVTGYYMNIVDGVPTNEAQALYNGTIINHTRSYLVIVGSGAPQYSAAIRFD